MSKESKRSSKSLRKFFCFWRQNGDKDHLVHRLNEVEILLKNQRTEIENQQTEINTLTQKFKEINEILKKTDETDVADSSSSTSNPYENNLTCERCNSTKLDVEWCSSCDIQYFIDHFSDWTSGNPEVDGFIQATQRNASGKFNFLEWIPYTSLKDIKQIGRGGFGTVYSAVWIDGPRTKWLGEICKWGRYPNVGVALKSINRKDYTTLFEEIQSYLIANKSVLGRMNTLRIFGMSKDPEDPENYIMVMLLAGDGDLGHYLKKNFSKLTYFTKLEILFDMITGILQIHNAGLVHRDLHRGNIMCQRFIKLDEGRDEYRFVIGDLGLAQKPLLESKNFCGVIPYCAPEVLEHANYSGASDIYSFGILMWELTAGVRAFSNRNHDESLIRDIISGLRPQPVPHTPNSYEILMKQCWAPNPSDRPSTQMIYETIGIWLQKLTFSPNMGISQEFLAADEDRLERLPVEELSPDARYYSMTYHTVNRMGFSPIAIDSDQN